ncbi:avidin-like [Poecile atricapillus]|uniref:avidin-like n=1 Tax=Poecile atricapillus TaxID=48891 RepID=UPI002739925C|nr:avidin-like [Poecile atricapillus]
MVQATPFLLVLFLALGAHGLSVKKCSLTGRWVNDLGSNMTIMTVNANGDFAGVYYTAVSDTTKKIKLSPLLGSQHQPNLLKQPTFGFTVHWTFSDSITVFTGQCFVDEDGKEVLKTMWLLRSHADKRRDDWNATLVGYNEFKRLEKHTEPWW